MAWAAARSSCWRAAITNARVVFETLTDYGQRFAIAQRYLPDIAESGDARVLLIEGEPVPYALARIPSADDHRGNLAAGARGVGRPLNERDRWLAGQIGPALAAKGMLFVGLDVIGGFVTEINVTSPTGIRELDKQFGISIGELVIAALERRLRPQGAARAQRVRPRQRARAVDAPCMARRALMLREGKAPVRDRLLTMLFLAGAAARAHHPRPHLQRERRGQERRAGARGAAGVRRAPGSDRNPTATYLAQRTQLGSGNTRDSVAAAQPRLRMPLPTHEGSPEGDTPGASDERGGSQEERVLTTSAWSTRVRYLADAGMRSPRGRSEPLLIDPPQRASPGPRMSRDLRSCSGPKRDELWITPDTRAATLAPYLDAWRRKVERIGTLNYPTAARAAHATRRVLSWKSASAATAHSTRR